MSWPTLADLRREYGDLNLSEASLEASPIDQFKKWFAEILEKAPADPTAMILSTVDEHGHPDSRVVLLKDVHHDKFVFYTNYRSTKAKQIEADPRVALNIYWSHMARQVRIRGSVQKLDSERSDQYFASRPRANQISAVVSPQSDVLENRDELEESIQALIEKNQEVVMRPEYWGGYEVTPNEIEFWQGRDGRLHDRIRYILEGSNWIYHRLAP